MQNRPAQYVNTEPSCPVQEGNPGPDRTERCAVVLKKQFRRPGGTAPSLAPPRVFHGGSTASRGKARVGHHRAAFQHSRTGLGLDSDYDSILVLDHPLRRPPPSVLRCSSVGQGVHRTRAGDRPLQIFTFRFSLSTFHCPPFTVHLAPGTRHLALCI
jgi:hypothetical protein